MRRKGFTLIELLVVIAIIAILAAILFPVFMRARVTANTTKCMSHGRELGIAMGMYMDDNSGRFPTNANWDWASEPQFCNITWRYSWPAYPAGHSDGPYHASNEFGYVQLAPYVRSMQIWICPAPNTYYSMKYAYLYRCSWWFYISTLGANGYPDTPWQESRKQPDGSYRGIGLTMPEVQAKDAAIGRYCPPSKKFFAMCYALGDDYSIGAWSGGPSITPSYAHDEGSVFVFADSHARYREMGCGFAPVGYTTNNLDRPHTHGL